MTRSSSSQESQALRERLSTGATALGLPLTASQLNALLAYLDQLVRWNKTFNLTAIREPAEMVDRHLLDSVAMLPLINRLFNQCSIHVMDVGTGAGLPGIPIAIARPGGSLTLVETNGKKAAFLRQCQIELSLSSVQICQSRIETLTPEQLELGKPDLIIARAFRGISEYLELIAPFVSDETVVLAMKGPALNDELDQMAQKIEANRVSEQLLSFLASHQMSTEVLEFANSQVTRQVAIFSSPSHSAIRPSAVSFQE